MLLALLFHYLMLNMFRMLIHPSIHPRELATYLLSYSMGCIVLVWCVFVLRCGLAVVVWYRYAGWGCLSLHTDTTPPQPNHNVTRTHIEPEQYNPWNNSTTKSQAPENGWMDVLTSETCWALNNEIIMQVTSSWSLFIQLSYIYIYICRFRVPFLSCFRKFIALCLALEDTVNINTSASELSSYNSLHFILYYSYIYRCH